MVLYGSYLVKSLKCQCEKLVQNSVEVHKKGTKDVYVYKREITNYLLCRHNNDYF